MFLLIALSIPILYWFLPYLLDPYKQRSIPGPFLAAISNIWVAKEARRGKRFVAVEKAHR
jgi:benzoate 4-monooxygenase